MNALSNAVNKIMTSRESIVDASVTSVNEHYQRNIA